MNLEINFPEFLPFVPGFLKICHRLYDKGLVTAYDGNVSLKVDQRVLVTPTHRCKGDLSAADLLVTDLSGHVLSGTRRASSEWKMHAAIYRENPQARCVVHAHPVFATALYRKGHLVHPDLLTESADTFSDIPVLPYAKPGSQALAESVGRALSGDLRVAILEAHGAVAWGTSLEEAYFLIESLERLAKTQYIVATMNFS